MHVIAGRDLPVQVFRGTYPSPDRLAPVAASFSTRIDGGLWTSSLLDGSTAWARFCAATGWQEHDIEREDWILTPDPSARIVVVDSVADYDALLAHAGSRVGGPHFPAWLVDWARVARDYAALWLTSDGVARCLTTYHSALLGLGLESTCWFRWVFTDVRLVNDWGRLSAWVPPGARSGRTNDDAAFQSGVVLPAAFRPDVQSGYLRIPVTAPSEMYGLAIALSRLHQHTLGTGPCWPETDSDSAKQGFAAWDRWMAVVEIRQRRAIGMAVTRATHTWGVARDGERCLIREQAQAVPQLHALLVFAVDRATWEDRAYALVCAAARANGVAPHELCFSGTGNDESFALVQRFKHQGALILSLDS